jgi:hypothetical protein
LLAFDVGLSLREIHLPAEKHLFLEQALLDKRIFTEERLTS